MRPPFSRYTTTIVVSLLVAACTSASSPAPSTTPASGSPASSSVTATQFATPGPTGASASPSLQPLPASGSLPVRGFAREIGVVTAAGPGGTLFVLVSGRDGSVLALLDGTGKPRPGWPITVTNSSSCHRLLPVADGSVRLVCSGTDLPQPDSDPPDVRAYAFDVNGRSMAGWPVELRPGPVGSVVGTELTVLEEQWLSHPGGDRHMAWVTTVAAKGAIERGVAVPLVEGCCWMEWAIGPDGVAYGVVPVGELTEQGVATLSSLVTALDLGGLRPGWPVEIDGMASRPAFDAAGRIHVTVGVPFQRPARTLVFDVDGRTVDAGSGLLNIAAPSEFDGIEGTELFPAPPLVGRDGTTYLTDIAGGGTTVAGLAPSGQVMSGWPYRSDAGSQPTGFCAASDVCEGSFWAIPAIAPDNVLYLIHATASASVGGSIVAVGPDGRVRGGWPVDLKKPGAEFWSVVVGSDGTVYALAIEPEANDTSSATILAIAPDSTVLWTTMVIEP